MKTKRRVSHSKAASERFVAMHIERHIKKYHMPKKQAVAVALSEARKKGYHVAKEAGKKRGGMLDYL